MLLDILFVICIVLAFINGFRRGLIQALFSFVAIFLALLIGLKCSYLLSDYLYREDFSHSKWLPLISFVLVFITVIMLMQLFAKLVEKVAEAMFLGVFNKIIGGLLEASVVAILFSTVLWYLDKQHLVSAETKQASMSYDYLVAIAPAVLSFISKLLPFFGNVFEQLEGLFRKMPPPQHNGGSVVA